MQTTGCIQVVEHITRNYECTKYQPEIGFCHATRHQAELLLLILARRFSLVYRFTHNIHYNIKLKTKTGIVESFINDKKYNSLPRINVNWAAGKIFSRPFIKDTTTPLKPSRTESVPEIL